MSSNGAGQQALSTRLAELKREYEALTGQLHPEQDKQQLAALMLEISANRAEIDRLSIELQRADAPNETGMDHPVEPAPSTSPQPTGSEQLSLRFLLEGPAGAGVTTVLEQLRDQFQAQQRSASSQLDSLRVDWFEFEAGQFNRLPISFQVFRLSGAVSRPLRRAARQMVDAVVAVVEATSAGSAAGRSYVSELLDDRKDLADADQPAVTIFGNKSDIDGALGVDELATDLLVESSVNIVSTTREQGFLYGFVAATNAGVRRNQRRDGLGLPRTTAITFDGLLGLVAAATGEHPAPGPTGSGPVANPFGPQTVVATADESIEALIRPVVRPSRRRRARALKKLIAALRNPEAVG